LMHGSPRSCPTRLNSNARTSAAPATGWTLKPACKHRPCVFGNTTVIKLSSTVAWPAGTERNMQKRILIVDDEPAIRDMVAFALRKADYLPVHAGDQKEASLALAEKIPDLILLDWMLPGMSGIDLVRRWRREELTRDIPIIMLTARGEENDRVA